MVQKIKDFTSPLFSFVNVWQKQKEMRLPYLMNLKGEIEAIWKLYQKANLINAAVRDIGGESYRIFHERLLNRQGSPTISKDEYLLLKKVSKSALDLAGMLMNKKFIKKLDLFTLSVQKQSEMELGYIDENENDPIKVNGKSYTILEKQYEELILHVLKALKV